MSKAIRHGIQILFISLIVFSRSAQAQINPEKEFIMSCTYGVLAGTLVGAALLAFEDDPGENLQHVARGASLGLYMGIGLGIYTAYILPKQIQKEENQILEDGIGSRKFEPPRFFVMPVIADGKVDGVGAIVNLARF